jgi:hypothetical protein
VALHASTSQAQRYPVLYLQQAHGRNEPWVSMPGIAVGLINDLDMSSAIHVIGGLHIHAEVHMRAAIVNKAPGGPPNQASAPQVGSTER